MESPFEVIEIRTTAPSLELAEKIADKLLHERLTACAQIDSPIESLYWWQGKQERAKEWRVSVRTRADLFSQVESGIKSVHPYEVPEIVAFSIKECSPDYYNWIIQETER